jgi:hypothetical protein
MSDAINQKWVDLVDATKMMCRTEIIDGYSYEVLITKGRFSDPFYEEGVKLDPKAVYLTIGVIDEVNGITHDHQVFDMSRYCELVYPPPDDK